MVVRHLCEQTPTDILVMKNNRLNLRLKQIVVENLYHAFFTLNLARNDCTQFNTKENNTYYLFEWFVKIVNGFPHISDPTRVLIWAFVKNFMNVQTIINKSWATLRSPPSAFYYMFKTIDTTFKDEQMLRLVCYRVKRNSNPW